MRLPRMFRSKKRDRRRELADLAWPPEEEQRPLLDFLDRESRRPRNEIAWELCAFRYAALALGHSMATSFGLEEDNELKGLAKELPRVAAGTPAPADFERWWTSRYQTYIRFDDGVSTLYAMKAEVTREFLNHIGVGLDEESVIRAYETFRDTVYTGMLIIAS